MTEMMTIDNSGVFSICIPRVDIAITETYIRNIFNRVLFDNFVEELDEHSKTNHKKQKKDDTEHNQRIHNHANTLIEKVDLIDKVNEKGEKYKRAFIHFRGWNWTDNENSNEHGTKINVPNYSRASKIIWNKLHAGEVIKIMHCEPNYWKCSISRVPRPQSQSQSHSHS